MAFPPQNPSSNRLKPKKNIPKNQLNNAIIINPKKMSTNKTTSKNHLPSHPKSPRHNYISQQTLADRNIEQKLSDKIHRLKSALRASEKHNQELHLRLKQYKMENFQRIPMLEGEIRAQRKRIGEVEREYQEEIGRLKAKREEDLRAVSAGKISNTSRIRQLEIEVKTKQMKIVQLQGIIKDLKSQLESKQSATKLPSLTPTPSFSPTLTPTNLPKSPQSHPNHPNPNSPNSNRQTIHLKQSLRDSLKKYEKANTQIYELTERNKKLEIQGKEDRKFVDVLKKENGALRDVVDKLREEVLERVDWGRKLEKSLVEIQYREKRETEKYAELTQQHTKLQQQFRSLLSQFQSTTTKYQNLLTQNYDLHRDFERELHTIVKQLTRRHIVSKTLTSPQPHSQSQQQQHHNHHHHQHQHHQQHQNLGQFL